MKKPKNPIDGKKVSLVRKKYAEQAAARTNLEAPVIESGVEELIEGSRQALGEGGSKPPYRRAVWYGTLFDLLQERKISKISLDFIRANIINASSEAYKFRAGLVFLGLIDPSGNPTPWLESLRLTGEQFRRNLEKVVKRAYTPIFDTVVLDRAKPEAIVNFIIQNYGYSRALAEEATQLFVWFCNKAGISLSKELESFQPTQQRTDTEKPSGVRSTERRVETRGEARAIEKDEDFIHLDTNDFSFKVRKDLHAIDFARDQVNSILDYWLRRLKQRDPVKGGDQ